MAEQLQTIERESKRCGELVKNLLTFSRQAPSHREPNDLNTVVHRAVLLVKHKLEMQNIELKESLADGLPPVECDANQIQQVMLVLMVNASEAMPKGGTLEVTTEFDSGRRAGRGARQGYGMRHPRGRAAADFRSVFYHQRGPEPHRPRAWRWRAASWSSTRGRSRSAPRRAKERNFGWRCRQWRLRRRACQQSAEAHSDGTQREDHMATVVEPPAATKTKGQNPDRRRRTGGARFAGQVVYQRRLHGAAGRQARARRWKSSSRRSSISRCSISRCRAWTAWSCRRACGRPIRT